MRLSDLAVHVTWLAIALFYFNELYSGGYAAFVGYGLISCLLSTVTMIIASLLFGVLVILPIKKLKD